MAPAAAAVELPLVDESNAAERSAASTLTSREAAAVVSTFELLLENRMEKNDVPARRGPVASPGTSKHPVPAYDHDRNDRNCREINDMATRMKTIRVSPRLPKPTEHGDGWQFYSSQLTLDT